MLIAFNGFMGAGKDTAGEYLVSAYGFKRIGFADKLKESFAALFDISLEEIEEWKNDPSMEVLIQRNLAAEVGRAKLRGEEPPLDIPHTRMTVRKALQRYGTESHRDVFGYDFWVDAALDEIHPADNVARYVITDCRFPNEAIAVRRKGGKVIEIIRPGHEGSGHASEQRLDRRLTDGAIFNTGTIEELHCSLDSLMEGYGVHPPLQQAAASL